MFGYIRYDLPNLFVKDFMLYKALYCGLCKGIARSCGNAARMGLSYDVTFLSALLHNMTGQDIRIEEQHCFEHCISRQPIACVDALTEELGALNTILVYYKLTDDIADGDRGRGKRLWFRRGFARAGEKYPELEQIVSRHLAAQAETEKSGAPSPDRAAEASAQMMQQLSAHFLKEARTPASDELFYAIGKWVYLIDALDDYDKDKKKGAYNPFLLSYGCANKKTLVSTQGEELSFLFDTLFYSLREALSGITFAFNRDLTDNILLRGLPAETARVLRGEKRQKAKKQVKVIV